jgi:hypothetical protein
VNIAFSSVSAFAAAVAEARTVDFSAYTLHAGAARDALVTAARSGARVRVRLERDPLDDAAGTLHAAARAAVGQLTAAGADAAVSAPGEPVLHLKAAVVDGVAWLDDRNWAGGPHETVLRDTDAADVALIGAALHGTAEATLNLATTKGAALALEVKLVRAAGNAPLAIESESFGTGGVYSALLARGRAALPTRLLVAGREAGEAGPGGDGERRRLAKLESLGVQVRTGNAHGVDLDEKLAIAETAAWAGSANASYARGAAGEQRDWGMTLREPAFVDGLRAAFEANWRAGVPFHAPQKGEGV